MSATSLARVYGGPALSVLRLGEALQQCGAKVGLWAADGTRPDQTTTLDVLDGALERALAEFGDPDIVHDNGLWLLHNHRLAVIARRSGWPRCVSPRGMLELWALQHKRAKKWIAWALYQRCDLNKAARLHATSALEAAGIDRLNLRAPVDVIPNGIDLIDSSEVERAWAARTKPGRALPRRMLFLGRLHPVKNLSALVDAWACVAPRDWLLVLAGPDEGGHRGALEDQIRRLGLQAVVTLPGPIAGTEKGALLLSADAFVLPSFQESFGMAAAEALAHGLPSITTKGTPWDALPSHGAGWHVAPTIDGLAAALQEATAISDVERRDMGHAAYAFMDNNYNWTNVGANMLRSYRSVLCEKS